MTAVAHHITPISIADIASMGFKTDFSVVIAWKKAPQDSTKEREVAKTLLGNFINWKGNKAHFLANPDSVEAFNAYLQARQTYFLFAIGHQVTLQTMSDDLPVNPLFSVAVAPVFFPSPYPPPVNPHAKK